MIAMKFGGALALSLLLAACGEQQNAGVENRQVSAAGPAAPQAGEIYSGAGQVKAIKGDQVTISHGPIEGIGWPAMTMTFTAGPSQLLGLGQGDEVAFSFRQQGSRSVITSIAKR